MKKILIIILLLFLITGCDSSYSNDDSETNVKKLNDDYIYHYTDKDTCVEYLVIKGSYKGEIIARLNSDGTVKINEECLNSKGE